MPKPDQPAPQDPKTQGPGVQGEGDHAADRRYRERTEHFLKTTDVEEVAREAAPKSPAEAAEMAAAEKEGRSHARLPGKRQPKLAQKERDGR